MSARAKKQFIDSGLIPGGSFEAIYDNDSRCFLVEKNGNFSTADSLEVNGENFYPKRREHLPYEPYGFHKGPVSSIGDLLRAIAKEFEAFVVADPIWIGIFSIFALSSYCQQKFQTVPYLALIGDNESGKSTVLQLMNVLCYRPMYGVTIPGADIYSYLKDSASTPTILEDEIQGIEKDFDKIKIYKAGYKRGAVVPRIQMRQNERIIEYYPTFCLKAFASEEIPRVKGLTERLITLLMVEGFPMKEWADVTKADLDEFGALRNRLLRWRMETRTQELPGLVLKIKGRMKELWKSSLQITYGLRIHDVLLEFVEHEAKDRLKIKQNSLDGHLVKVVVDILNNMADPSAPVLFRAIWADLAKDLDGKLDYDKPNVMNTEEFGNVFKNKVGYRLREVLCGRSETIREKDPYGNEVIAKAYIFDADKVQRVAKKYGYELVTKLPTSPSSGGAQTP